VNWNQYNLSTVGSLASQVRAGAKIILGYVAQEKAPEESVQQLTQIIDALDDLMKNVIDKAHEKDLDEQAGKMLYHESFVEWKSTLEVLVRLVDQTTWTNSPTHSQKIKEINQVFKEKFLPAKEWKKIPSSKLREIEQRYGLVPGELDEFNT
jgi:basic membrane lipoprotein Med (substrate-binding protein (PBP1-ABC) superfamily)